MKTSWLRGTPFIIAKCLSLFLITLMTTHLEVVGSNHESEGRTCKIHRDGCGLDIEGVDVLQLKNDDFEFHEKFYWIQGLNSSDR